jgi:hypothetical protein
MVKKEADYKATAKRVLSSEEYEDYKKYKDVIKKRQVLQQLGSDKRTAKQIERQEKYSKTPAGKFAGVIAKGLGAIRQRNPVSNFLYRNQTIPSTRKTIASPYQRGRVGRPAGSYDQRYAQYGGVYGYRKMLSAQMQLQKIQAIRQQVLTPQQQQVLNQIEARRQFQAQDPERRTFPDTSGRVSIGSYQDEIARASNLVD